MPLVKKQSGWFWGSKGPFDSKAKALSVARAAYASGYKKEGNQVISIDLSEIQDKSVNNSLFFREALSKLN
jgi:hypothetical protein